MMQNKYAHTSFYPITLSTVVFPQRSDFCTVCLVHYLLWGTHTGQQRENILDSALQIAEKCISNMCSDCRNIQRLSLSFISQFRMVFLLSFTDCRRVLGKVPGAEKHGI